MRWSWCRVSTSWLSRTAMRSLLLRSVANVPAPTPIMTVVRVPMIHQRSLVPFKEGLPFMLHFPSLFLGISDLVARPGDNHPLQVDAQVVRGLAAVDPLDKDDQVLALVLVRDPDEVGVRLADIP